MECQLITPASIRVTSRVTNVSSPRLIARQSSGASKPIQIHPDNAAKEGSAINHIGIHLRPPRNGLPNSSNTGHVC